MILVTHLYICVAPARGRDSESESGHHYVRSLHHKSSISNAIIHSLRSVVSSHTPATRPAGPGVIRHADDYKGGPLKRS